ncbi:hypothetical protein [Phormidesmis priestleyi]|uniref:hypothetical protein n=1 Tax=Phormidesmis priestleyi TaxID=268141 RepID=UPI00083B4C3D|nr:hypothetical protein [Phormidesmis priestleyi]
MNPSFLNKLFPLEHQKLYASMLQKRGGLTRRRAECFVRLWAYLLLKQQEELAGKLPEPLSRLEPPEGSVACTHREAAELFYGDQERGSDRAAGMMIDRLAALGLLEKQYDGQTLCLQVQSLPELTLLQVEAPMELFMDDFNPRTDAIPVAHLYARSYAELVRDGSVIAKIARTLRTWAQEYPVGMRVIRRSDNLNVVGIAILFPVSSESEFNFFQPPSKSFYLTTDNPVDPFKIASVNDINCTSVYIRAWIIDPPFFKASTLYQLLEDTRTTLNRMQSDFPQLCDLYSVVLHPVHEELRRVLGFERIYQDTQRSYSWVYLAADRFANLDFKQALANLRIGESS